MKMGKLILLAIVLTGLLLPFNTQTVYAQSWLEGWGYRIKIDIDYTNKINGSVTWFPVTIFLKEGNGDTAKVFDEVGSNWSKIAITQADGTTQLYVEVEQWDSVNKTGVLHTSSSNWTISANTSIYLYYDNNQPNNTGYVGDVPGSSPTSAVWDNNFKAVYHLKDYPNSSSIEDSTSNVVDGTKQAATDYPLPSEVDAVVGKGQSFNPTNVTTKHKIVCDDSSNRLPYGYSPVTVEGWIKTALSVERYFFGWGTRATRQEVVLGVQAGKFCLESYGGSKYGNTSVNDSVWHYVVAKMPNTGDNTLALFVDNIPQTLSSSGTWGTINITSSQKLDIGRLINYDGYYYQGQLDELRISNVERSDAWIKGTYNTLNDSLLSYGVKESTTDKNLVVNITGVGNISVNGTTPSSYPNTTKWVVNTTITINATPDPCWKFVNWTGDNGTIANVTASNTTINMTDSYSIVANFVQVLDVETLNATGVGATVATLNGNITEAGCEVLERGFEWYTSYTAWGLPEDLYAPDSWDSGIPLGDDGGEGPIVWESQSFTPLMTHNVTGIGIRGGQVADCPSPGNVTVSIREADENQTPTGSDLCNVTFNGNDTELYDGVFQTGGAWYFWDVSPEITLYAGENYTIVVHALEADDSHRFAWNVMLCEEWDGRGIYPNQSFLYSVNGTSWNNSNADLVSGIFSEGLWNEWTEEGSFATGEFNHTITNLTCNTTYYYRAMARDSIGWVYGDWVSFTTMSCPRAPLNFTVTQIGTSAALLNWTNYPGTQYTIIRTSTDGYPNLTTGYLIFNNTTTNYTDTGLSLEQTTYYYTAWGYNPDVYSSDTAKGKIGGEVMVLLFIIGFAGIMTFISFRSSFFGLKLMAGMVWFAVFIYLKQHPPAGITEGSASHVALLAIAIGFGLMIVLAGLGRGIQRTTSTTGAFTISSEQFKPPEWLRGKNSPEAQAQRREESNEEYRARLHRALHPRGERGR